MATNGVQGRPGGVQKLDRALNSVDGVLTTLLGACAPVRPVSMATSRAVGLIAAQDFVAPGPLPLRAEALMDGRAVASAELIGASSMSPAYATREPVLVRVGDPVPLDCDCVIDDALVIGASGVFEIHGAAAPGDGIRRAGEDVGSGAIMLRAGARITLWHKHVLEAAGCVALDVRHPRVRIVAASGDDGAVRLIAALAREEGMDVQLSSADASVEDALDGEWDVALVVGGTGGSVEDRTVETLRKLGQVIAHGFALDPGRTGAAGLFGGKPVVCIPGRFDSALALYLALVRPLLRHVSGAGFLAHGAPAPLARKIASSVGVAQVCLLETVEGRWAPLAVGDITLAGLLRAQAYIVVPHGSEGMAEGAFVKPLSLPGWSACA